MRKLLFRCAEALGIISKSNSPLYEPLDLSAIYAAPTDETRAKLADLLEGHRKYFRRYGEITPELLGFTEESWGSFGQVYISPCERFALKVSFHNDDVAYGTYVNISMQRQHNPFFPKIYAHLKSGNRNVVLMERLDELPMDPASNAFVKSTKERVRARIPISPDCKRYPEGYAELVDDLTMLVHTFRYKCDIRAHNVMVRPMPGGKAQYVVTDPVC